MVGWARMNARVLLARALLVRDVGRPRCLVTWRARSYLLYSSEVDPGFRVGLAVVSAYLRRGLRVEAEAEMSRLGKGRSRGQIGFRPTSSVLRKRWKMAERNSGNSDVLRFIKRNKRGCPAPTSNNTPAPTMQM